MKAPMGETEVRFDPDSDAFKSVQELFEKGRAEEARAVLRGLVDPNGDGAGARPRQGDADALAAEVIYDLTTKEIARRFGVSSRTVTRWRRPRTCQKCGIEKPHVAFDRVEGAAIALGRLETCRKCIARESAPRLSRRRGDAC